MSTEQKPVASFDQIREAKGTHYETIEAYGVVLRLGSLSSADMMEWIEEDSKAGDKAKVAGIRILVKALVDADGKRVPENQREDFVNEFKQKDNAENGKVIKKVLEMNGLRAPDKKGDELPVVTEIKNA